MFPWIALALVLCSITRYLHNSMVPSISIYEEYNCRNYTLTSITWTATRRLHVSVPDLETPIYATVTNRGQPIISGHHRHNDNHYDDDDDRRCGIALQSASKCKAFAIVSPATLCHVYLIFYLRWTSNAATRTLLVEIEQELIRNMKLRPF